MSSGLQDPRRGLLLIAVGALVVRVVAVVRWSRDLGLEGDQLFYHHQAIDLAGGNGFVYRHPAGELVTTAVHPPLYSAWLGLVSLLGLDSPDAHRVAGAVLGGATVVVGGLAANRLAGGRAALIAGLLLAVAPTLWINDSMVLSESMYAFTVALVLLASVSFIAEPDRMRAIGLGGAIALAGLARAEAALLVVLLAVPLVVVRARRRGPGEVVVDAEARHEVRGPESPVRRPGPLALLCWLALAGIFVAGPWLGRNLTSFERPATISSGGGFVLEISSCDETFYGSRLGYWDVSCDRTAWPPGDETVVEAAKREAAVEYVGDNLGRLPVVVAARVGRMWDVWRPGESVELNSFFERRGRDSSQAAIWVWWAMAAAAVPGAWALRRRPVTLVPFAAVAAATTAAAAMSFGITRYRTGMEVAAAVLAGVGLAWLVGLVSARLSWRSAAGGSGARVGGGGPHGLGKVDLHAEAGQVLP